MKQRCTSLARDGPLVVLTVTGVRHHRQYCCVPRIAKRGDVGPSEEPGRQAAVPAHSQSLGGRVTLDVLAGAQQVARAALQAVEQPRQRGEPRQAPAALVGAHLCLGAARPRADLRLRHAAKLAEPTEGGAEVVKLHRRRRRRSARRGPSPT